jgi:hypothetical protein
MEIEIEGRIYNWKDFLLANPTCGIQNSSASRLLFSKAYSLLGPWQSY